MSTVNVAAWFRTQGRYIKHIPNRYDRCQRQQGPPEHVQFYGIVRFNVASNYSFHLEASRIEVCVCWLQALSPPIGGAGM